MFNALRRVISDASEIGQGDQQGTTTEEEHQQQPTTTTTSRLPLAAPPALVTEESNAAARPQQSSLSSSPSSSCSDLNNNNTIMEVEDIAAGGAAAEQQQQQQSRQEDDDDDNDVTMMMDTTNHHGNHNTVEADVSAPPAANLIRMEASNTHMNLTTMMMTQRNRSTAANNNNNNMTSTDTMASSTSKDSSHRSDNSHKGSATSSRDWGWFEEVHVADVGFLSAPTIPTHGSSRQSHGHGPTTTTTVGSSSSNGGIGHNHHHHGNNSPYYYANHTIGGANHHHHDSGDVLMSTPQEIVHTAPHDDEAAAMAVTAPNYVLEESLSSQRLWHDTAGTRPPQPMEERQFFERMWAQNFERSQVNYGMPQDVLTAETPSSLNPFADGVFADNDGSVGSSNYHFQQFIEPVPQGDNSQDGNSVTEAALVAKMNDENSIATKSPTSLKKNSVPGTKSDGDLTVVLRGPNGYGTMVSKSFARSSENGATIMGVDTVNISIASYRVVESKKYGKFAQFLVIYREGGIRDTVGVWKRYRDFEELSHKVTQAHEGCAAVIANMSPLAMTEEPEIEHLPNAIMSWRLLKKRKRWYRCLDANYLSLKVFLLERFLHDILFESSSPNLLREFVLGQEEAHQKL
mmetsp:Transcript_29973/g.69894  ORF Transcript_29973/g.69894 Transcript_29973/m.69894 type:complete len:630 (+) Transcript_29973:476-2365(+)